MAEITRLHKSAKEYLLEAIEEIPEDTTGFHLIVSDPEENIRVLSGSTNGVTHFSVMGWLEYAKLLLMSHDDTD